MKNCKIILAGLLLLAATGARAALFQSFTVNETIPVDNPAGLVSVGNFTAASPGDRVQGVNVSLNISGGYNGNLYAYLIAPNGTLVVLLNEPGVAVNGFGASGAGMNITLTDNFTAQGNIQNVTSGAILSGTYNAAGSLSNFGSPGSPGGLVNGNWTLFFTDQTSGGGTSTLNSWSLDITVVPEPANVALAGFGLLFGGGKLARCWLRRNRSAKFET